MRSFRSRTALVALASLALVPVAPALNAEAATPTKFSYTGSAFGTSVTVGSVVKSGPSAYLVLGCTSNGNIHRTNSTAEVKDFPPVLGRVGAVSTTGDTYASPVRTRTSASTAGVDLLGSRIKATAIKAGSYTTRTSTGYSLSSNGTSLLGLEVGGRAISASTAPNTRINLAGIGYVIVNEQIRRTNGLTVNGLHVVVNTTNTLGFAVGTNIIVSQAVSGLSGPVHGVVNGYAYGSKVVVGTTVTSGATFPAYVPCLGTRNAVRTNTGAGVVLDEAGSSGTITNTASGNVTTSETRAETTSTIQTVDLLDGLVKADVIKARARAGTLDGVTKNFSAYGSTFGSLSVLGRPDISAANVPTEPVLLPGVGTLYLRRVSQSSNGISVIMIELALSNTVSGQPAGSNIRVAVAAAGLS
jgi:hypothetical protein